MIGKQSTLNDLSGLDVKIDQNHSEAMASSAAAMARANSGIVGSETQIGTRALAIASYFTSDNLSRFIHIKTALRPDSHSEMFHLNITGYCYGESKAVDMTFVGYCYSADATLLSVGVIGSHVLDTLPAAYITSDGFIAVRIYFPTTYFLSLVVDSMRVGNGRLLSSADIQIINAAEEAL